MSQVKDRLKKKMIVRNEKYIEERTGEVVECRVIGLFEDFKHLDRNFVKVFDVFTRRIVEDKEIAGKSIRLLFWILDKIRHDETEFIMIAKEVAEELKVSLTTVKTWRSILIRKGVIEKVGQNVYRLNAFMVFRGNAKKYLASNQEYVTIKKKGGQ